MPAINCGKIIEERGDRQDHVFVSQADALPALKVRCYPCNFTRTPPPQASHCLLPCFSREIVYLQRSRGEFFLRCSCEEDVAGFAAVEARVDAGEVQAVAIMQGLHHHLTSLRVYAAMSLISQGIITLLWPAAR
jgi:hypothetical protein